MRWARPEFDGDATATAPTGPSQSPFAGHNWYCIWRGVGLCGLAFFTDSRLLRDYEPHMKAVLDHVNPLTGLAYKDDPTFAGWVDGNNLNLFDGVPPPLVEAFPVLQGGDRIDGLAPLLHLEAAEIAAAGKVYATVEYGWDNTNFLTTGALKQFVDGLAAYRNVGGDNFWALQSHANGHAWQPIPGDMGCRPTCVTLEDGNWWALYYTGVTTLSNQAADMAARAQLLRSHAYAMSGFFQAPSHELAPAPIVTSTTGGKVLFEGSAGSPRYTIQRLSRGRWSTICDRCTTDAAGGWQDPALTAGCYRVTGYNLDGVAGSSSQPAGVGCSMSAPRLCPRARTMTIRLTRAPNGKLTARSGQHMLRTDRHRSRVIITVPPHTPRRITITLRSGSQTRRLTITSCAAEQAWG
jgi:hypothetical protein